MKFCGIILISLLSIVAQAQNTEEYEYDLRSLLTETLNKNREIEISRSKADLNSLSFRSSSTDLKPQVNLKANYNYFLSEPPLFIFPEDEGSVFNAGIPDGPYPINLGLQNNFFVDLSIQQRLLDARYFAGDNAEKIVDELSKGQIEKTQLKILKSTSSDFFQLAFLESNRQLIEFNISRLNSIFAITKSRFENELGRSFDTLRVSKEIASLNLEAKRLEESMKLLRDKLIFISGNEQLINQTNFQLENSLLNIFPLDENQVSIDSKLLTYSKQLNELKMKSQKSSWIPTMDIYGDLYFLSQSESLNLGQDAYWNNLSQIGLALNLPIYQGNKSRNEYQRLKIENEIIDYQYGLLQSGSEIKIQKARTELEYYTEKYQLELDWKDALSSEFEIEEDKFENEIVGLVELLEMQSEVIEQERKINELLLQIRLTEVDLIFEMGFELNSLSNNEDGL